MKKLKNINMKNGGDLQELLRCTDTRPTDSIEFPHPDEMLCYMQDQDVEAITVHLYRLPMESRKSRNRLIDASWPYDSQYYILIVPEHKFAQNNQVTSLENKVHVCWGDLSGSLRREWHNRMIDGIISNDIDVHTMVAVEHNRKLISWHYLPEYSYMRSGLGHNYSEHLIRKVTRKKVSYTRWMYENSFNGIGGYSDIIIHFPYAENSYVQNDKTVFRMSSEDEQAGNLRYRL